MLRKVSVLVLLSLILATVRTNAGTEDILNAKEKKPSTVTTKELSLAQEKQANASTESESAAEEEWYPSSVGPLTTWTAPLCAKGQLLIQPFFFYNRARGAFDSEGKYSSLNKGDRKYQYQEQFFIEYGITDRLEIAAQAVYQQNYMKQDGVSAQSSGFGDSYLFLRYCAIEETNKGKGWVPQVTGMLQLKMPTGKYQKLNDEKLGTDYMGTGSWDPGVGIIMTKRIKPFVLHADAVWSFPQKVLIDKVKTKYSPYATYDFGIEYFLPKGFNLMLEANGYLESDTWQDGARAPGTSTQYLVVGPGVGWSNDKIQTLLAYQRTLIGKNTDANDSVVLTCVYNF